MRTYIEIISLEYIFSLIFTREFLLCAHGWVGQTQIPSWRRISQSEIRNLAAAKKSWNWNFAKTKRGASGGFLPRPLLLRLRYPNLKTNEPKFWQILSPKNSFAKTSSALFRHLPEYLEGRTPKEKHSFLPPRALRVRSVGIGVAFKIHSKFVQ